jgi:deoxyribonuclease V
MQIIQKHEWPVVVLSFPDLQLKEKAIVESGVYFPYISGFLSVREVPPILRALENLTITPDLILCDGQGLAKQTGIPTLYRFG